MSPRVRCQQFPEQGLTVAGGKVFCQACKEEQPNLKVAISRHVESTKHKQKLAAFYLRSRDDAHLEADLTTYFNENKDIKGVHA